MSAVDRAVSAAMTRIVGADTDQDVVAIGHDLPTVVLRGLADLLYLDPHGRRPALIDRVVTEARG
jgi:hypothetical protein